MSEAMVWWSLAAGLVALELLTGTFYLLMLSIGLAAGALASHAGLAMTLQMTVAALVGGGAVAAWRWRQGLRPAALRATANKDVNMDIGETVQVKQWRDERQTRVSYRGADWSATLAAGSEPHEGPHRIVEVVGNRLILKPLKQTS